MSDWFLLAFEVAPLRLGDDDDVDGGLAGWWKHEASPFVGCFQKMCLRILDLVLVVVALVIIFRKKPNEEKKTTDFNYSQRQSQTGRSDERMFSHKVSGALGICFVGVVFFWIFFFSKFLVTFFVCS